MRRIVTSIENETLSEKGNEAKCKKINPMASTSEQLKEDPY